MDKNKKERIINLALYQGNRFIKDLLREKKLPIGNTEKEFQINIRKSLDNEELSEKDIADWLDKVEGWGDQQAFIIKPLIDGKELLKYSDLPTFTKLAQKANKEKLINRSHINLMPANKKLTLIQHSENRIRFVWHESLDQKRRLEDKDYEVYDKDLESKIYYQAYQERWARGVASFDWRIDLNLAAIFIPRNTKEDYEEARKKMNDEIKQIIPNISQWNSINISEAIFALDDKANAEKPEDPPNRKIKSTKTNFSTAGGTVSLESTNKETALQDNIALQTVRKSISGKSFSGKRGEFYLSSDSKDKDLHVILYGELNRVAFPRQMVETSVWNFIEQIAK